MSLRIISKKILKPEFSRVGLVNYTNDLSQTARIQKGFKNSKSYWSIPIDNTPSKIIIITISEWKTTNDWKNWLKSKDRTNIYNIYKEILEKETFSAMINKIENDDVFLL